MWLFCWWFCALALDDSRVWWLDESSLCVAFSSMCGVMWVWTRVSHWLRLDSSANLISMISLVIVFTMYVGSMELLLLVEFVFVLVLRKLVELVSGLLRNELFAVRMLAFESDLFIDGWLVDELVAEDEETLGVLEEAVAGRFGVISFSLGRIRMPLMHGITLCVCV